MSNIIVAIGVTICATSALSAMIISMLAYAKVVGMEKSTHKIEYIPIDPTAKNTFGEDIKKFEREIEDDIL